MPKDKSKKQNNSTHKTSSKTAAYSKDDSRQKIASVLRVVLLIAVLTAVFFPPYLRGLYFEEETLPTEIYIFAVFIVFWVYKMLKRDKRFLETPVDYASFGMVIVYLLSLFVAVSQRLAVVEFLKYCMYFAMYFMVTELIDTWRAKKAILWAVAASGTGVALIGIDGFANGHLTNILNELFKTLHINVSFFDTFLIGRIYSTLQYPNALGAYLIAIFFTSIALLFSVEKSWQRAIAGAITGFSAMIMLLTVSQGAYIAFAFACVIFLIVLPKESRARVVVRTIEIGLAAVAGAALLYRYTQAPQGHEKEIWLIASVVLLLSGVMSTLPHYLSGFLGRISWKVYAGIAGGLTVAGATVFAVFHSRIIASLADPSGAGSRADFYRDAVKVLKDYWLTGGGGGAWQSLYHMYQSYNYPTATTHSYFLQLGLEVGILGLLVFIVLLLSVVVLFLSKRRKKRIAKEDERILQSSIGVAVLALAMHSFIDFDFSLSAVFLLFWELLAVFNSKYRDVEEAVTPPIENNLNRWLMNFLKWSEKVANPRKLRMFPVIGLFAAMIIIIFPFNLNIAKGYASEAYKAPPVKTGNNKALLNIKKAVDSDGSNPVYRIDYADLLIAKKGMTQEDLTEANKQAEKAYQLAKFDYDYYNGAAKEQVLPRILRYYFNTGDVKNGLDIVEKAVQARPMEPGRWETKADAYKQVMELYLGQNNAAEVGKCRNSILEIVNQVTAINKKNEKPFKLTDKTYDIITKAESTNNSQNAIETDNTGSLVLNSKAPFYDFDLDGKPDEWSVYRNASNIDISIKNNLVKVINTTKTENSFIQSRVLNMPEGAHTYQIEVRLNDSANIPQILFQLAGLNDKVDILKKNQTNGYSAVVTSVEGFKPGNNVLLLGIQDRLEIQQIKISILQ